MKQAFSPFVPKQQSLQKRSFDYPLGPGQKLRRVRERLNMRFRDVYEASQRIAAERGSREYTIGLSRLADIENKGTLPSIYRAYSLAAIYALEISTVLGWYGIKLDDLLVDAARVKRERSAVSDFRSPSAEVQFPSILTPGFDSRQTAYLSRQLQRWGKVPADMFGLLDLRNHRYGFIGTEDWSMFPILPPGSFVQVDESKRKINSQSWEHEYERPIFFLEHRNGYCCGWCTMEKGRLIWQPHSSSEQAPQFFAYPGEVDVIGQVVGAVMRLAQVRRRHKHS